MITPLLERISPLIHQILQAPSIIPSQVSAKTVRNSLVDDYSIDKEQLVAEKDAVKALILEIFQEIYPAEGGTDETEDAAMKGIGSETVTPTKKKPQHPSVSQTSINPSSPAVPLVDDTNKKKRKRKAGASVDEDLARKLHQSFNEERSTRGASSGRARKRMVAAESSKGKKSRVKSKAVVDDDEGGDSGSASDDGKGKKKKKSKVAKSGNGATGAAKGGFSKPMLLSPELAEVLSTNTLSRPQVVKQIWDYIKNHGLQNPHNKRVIMCDEKLRKVFKVLEIDMFQMNKVLSSHLRSPEE